MTSPMISQSNGDIGLVTCGRNEGPYILEWVAWHRFIGFNRIRYYDNESNDSSREILDALSSLGVIESYLQPDMQGVRPQTDAYNKALGEMKACEWIGFWDVDEFLVPSVYPFVLKDWLSTFAEDISAIAINWRIIGSSGKIFAEESPVIKRFTKGSLITHVKNDHVKTIVRSAKTSFMNIHIPLPKDIVGSISNARGTVVEPYKEGNVHPPCWSPVVLHHYIVKSREELLRKYA
jgi:O-antigen biosynthesis protein